MTERVTVPGDKSIGHRALILAALATGSSVIRGLPDGEDVGATIRVLRQLGVTVTVAGNECTVIGSGPGGLQAPAELLDCGNSGTTARLMLGVLAGAGVRATVTGDHSLRSRPSTRITEPLSQMGAEFEAAGEGFPVKVVTGASRGISYRLPVASAQIKSSVLLAGLAGGYRVSCEEPSPSRDHTERMLQALGIDLVTSPIIALRPGPVPPFECTIPGDVSSSAFLFAAALLRGQDLTLDGLLLNPTRTAFLDVLERMGVTVERRELRTELGEPVGRVTVQPTSLRGVEIEPDEVASLIDEIPILAVLAARADGQTRFDGVGELRVKESDRLALLEENLGRCGTAVETGPDWLAVTGGSAPAGSVDIETAGDHRIAMAFSAWGAAEELDFVLSESGSHRVSFPGFFEAVEAVCR